MLGWNFSHANPRGEPLNGPKYPDQKRRADWERYKDRIMAYWMREPESHKRGEDPLARPGGPFTRPWAWWHYAAGNPLGKHYYGYQEAKDFLIENEYLTETEKQILES